MNQQQEEAVWRRVLATQEQPCAGSESSLTPMQVMEQLQRKQQAACMYGILARRVKKSARGCLLRLMQMEQQHSRRLEAVYYVMTGQRPCPDSPKLPCVACTNEELRNCYMAKIAAAPGLCQLAEQAGSFAPVFRCIHRDEQHQLRVLLNLLEHCL